MGQPPAQPITFFVPEVFITVSVEDGARVVTELRRSARAGLRPDRLMVADGVEAALGPGGTQQVVVPELPESQQAALIRAVEHLRWSERSIGGELDRLHLALSGWVPLPHLDYEVEFGYGGERCRFTSYTGRYEIGDRLPLRTPDACWEVIAVDPPGAGSLNERLIVDCCGEGAAM